MTDLALLLRDPGFTPGRRHLAPLLDLLGASEDEASLAERALLRSDGAVLPLVSARLASAAPPARGRLTRLLGRLLVAQGGDPRALVPLLDDADLPTRRQAALALGKLPGDGVEQALLGRWTPGAPVAFLRCLAESLGKIGGEAAQKFLAEQRPSDPELARLVGRAGVMLARSAPREEEQGIAVQARSPGLVPVVLRCKRGLESVLLDEARGAVRGLRDEGAGLLRGDFQGPLARLASLRVALSFGFSLPPVRVSAGQEAAALVAALTSPEALALVKAWGPSPARFRVAWRDGGHRRAVLWETARLMQPHASTWINDPSRTAWELLAWEREGLLFSELIPRALPEMRFGYRREDVPAASHPTVAAALARVGGVEPDDVVWDPFVGSGMELCERSLLGPYAELHGTDRDQAALDVARDNLASAGARPVFLTAIDARLHRVPGLSLVLSNPPLGHRVARQEDLAAVLDAVVASAARQLRPRGRLVWLSPIAERSARVGQAAGLDVERRGRVDLGGVEAELQVMRARGASGKGAVPSPGRR